jgi:hypothetical protein
MTQDNLATTTLDLADEIAELQRTWQSYQASVEAERASVALIISELMDALSFLFEHASLPKLASSFRDGNLGARWVSQTRALYEAVDLLRRNVPQSSASTPTTEHLP